MRAGRAGSHDGMVGALQSMLDRDIAGRKVDQAARNEERRHLARAALLEEDRSVGNAGESADAGSNHGAGGAAFFFGSRMPIGVVERLRGRAHRIDDEVVNLALVLRLHPLVGIEGSVCAVAARNHAGDLAREVGHVERVDLFRAAAAGQDSRPGRFHATAEWRDHAEPRDDHPSHVKTPPRNMAAHNKKPGDRATTARPASSAAARGQLFAFFSRNLVASPTVRIVSAASSGISQPNSSSNAITSSTVSRLSAPRSSMKLALSTTFSGSTPRCSTTIFLTRSPISLIVQPRACSIRPDAHPSHPGRVNSLVPVAVAHCPDLAPSLRTEARRMTAGSAPPIYRVSKSCNGVLCRAVRGCGYHTPATLTTSPNRSPKKAFAFRRRAAKCLKTWPFRR